LLLIALPTQVPSAHRGGPGGEGPLDNDSFLPTSQEAEADLAAGDRGLAALRASKSAGARARTEVFEAWHDALAACENGASVVPRPLGSDADARSPWPDPDGTADRRTEGVECAVLRRLAALGDEERAAWTARFASLARDELAAAGGDPRRLAEVERRHPVTAAAAEAALGLGDRALEAGRLAIARTWFERARRHLDLGALASEPRPGLAEGLRRRLEAIAALAPAAPEPGAWARARDLEPRFQVALADPARTPALPPRPGMGVRPGMTFMDGGLAVVQAPERVFLFDGDGGRRVADFQPNRLLGDRWTTAPLTAQRSEPPGWPLLPATDGEHLVLVQGRLEGRLANVLLCTTIERPPALPTAEGGGTVAATSPPTGPWLPRLSWALWEGLRMDGSGAIHPSGLGLLPGLEFQPGPLVVGSQVICQVRERPAGEDGGDVSAPFRTEGEVRSWLVALDLVTGEVHWKRFLAKGVELARGQGRFGGRSAGVSSAQPLARLGDRVFAGTHTGVGVLVDAADGRVLWSLKSRRRDFEDRGWSGSRPPAAGAGLVWAPADGDHAYWLRGDADLGGRGPFRHPPRAIGEGLALFGGEPDRALVLSRAGREFTLSAWDAASGGRVDSPFLGPGESFTGEGLASPERAYFATQTGLYLVDRERDLFVLDYAPLSSEGVGTEPGGSVHAYGDRVYVVGPRMLWTFEAR